jgi:hypothetical protein
VRLQNATWGITWGESRASCFFISKAVFSIGQGASCFQLELFPLGCCQGPLGYESTSENQAFPERLWVGEGTGFTGLLDSEGQKCLQQEIGGLFPFFSVYMHNAYFRPEQPSPTQPSKAAW